MTGFVSVCAVGDLWTTHPLLAAPSCAPSPLSPALPPPWLWARTQHAPPGLLFRAGPALSGWLQGVTQGAGGTGPCLRKPGQLCSAPTLDPRLGWPCDLRERLLRAEPELFPPGAGPWVDLTDGHVPGVILGAEPVCRVETSPVSECYGAPPEHPQNAD